MWIVSVLLLLVTQPALAAPGSGNGGGNGGGNIKPPAMPIAASPSDILAGSTSLNIVVTGESRGGSQFIQNDGVNTISATFSGSGIAINSITVDSTTALSLNITVDLFATVGGRTLTVTNPDGQSVSSIDDIIKVVAIPVINSASTIPGSPASTAQDLSINITDVTIPSGGSVTYTYQWYEGTSLVGTSSTLPFSSTSTGASYHCVITPHQDLVSGPEYTTNSVFIASDNDGDNMNDDWEVQYFNSTSVDPNGDADGDGLSNIMEYVFGLIPNDSKSCCVIKQAINPSTGQLSYSRPAANIPGVTYKLLVSTDMVNWTEESIVSETENFNGASKTVTVGINPAKISANQQLFARISASW